MSEPDPRPMNQDLQVWQLKNLYILGLPDDTDV